MKIGILTLPLHTNYGGILQAYALQTILERMGHDVLLIDGGIHHLPIWRTVASLIKRFVVSFGIKNNQQFSSFYIRQFVRKNINFLPKEKLVDESTFDAIIVGSDQVWRSLYTKNIEYYFLDFAKKWKIKKIAYAASFGIDYWDYSIEKTKLCKELASYFDKVSVREENGVSLCCNYLGVKASMMVDPTLLIPVNEYRQIASLNKKIIRGKLLVYILDNTIDKTRSLYKLVNEVKMECFELNGCSSLLKQYPSIEYWLDGFSNAKYVFTDSFHGCVFSLIFNIPFVVYGNSERGMSRFHSLLKLFNLEERLIYNSSDICKVINRPINWNEVNQYIKKYQLKAVKYLEECLTN